MSTGQSVSHTLISLHLHSGEMQPGEIIGLRIDQTLCQDATGTLVMQQLEAMGVERAATECSAQYVDHNLLQLDYKNADDHLFLHSAAQRFGLWYSRPGNGISHPLHMQRFGRPGATLLGSDSHTCASGALGMLAIGAGGLDVALAVTGEPFYMRMPKIRRIELSGTLPPWLNAKDIILALLQRHDVDGGVGWIFEYSGPGLQQLDAMQRHTIANMGAEMGLTASVFPSDTAVEHFLKQQRRPEAFRKLQAGDDAVYDAEEELKLNELEPLIACPSSPGNVVPVTAVAGKDIAQAYIGSSANPGLADFVIPALMVRDQRVHDNVSFDVNPTTRQMLADLSAGGWLNDLIMAGARIHQTGCNGCIGMGQAPASGRNSLRTVPRNFPGRSGTAEDSVYLCSPETATASALRGCITDPREFGEAPSLPAFADPHIDTSLFVAPPAADQQRPELVTGPNIAALPELKPLPEFIDLPIALKTGHDVSTDEILPAGAEVLPLRSNIPAISDYAFQRCDKDYARRMKENGRTDHIVIGGRNYGQGSSREHAALAPRYLGLRIVISIDFARIHEQNLSNFGMLPLRFTDAGDYDKLEQGMRLQCNNIHEQLKQGTTISIYCKDLDSQLQFEHRLSTDQLQDILQGSRMARVRQRLQHEHSYDHRH